MKILIMSDLHMEFGSNFSVPNIERDLLILAGDVNLGTKADAFILEQLVESDVIYVLGNHEFYNQILPKVRDAWSGPTVNRINSEAEAEGYRGKLYVLDDTSVTLNNITFIGSTLWTNFGNGDPDAMKTAAWGMNDYNIIYTDKDAGDAWLGNVKLQPEDTLQMHETSLAFIKEELAKEGKKVLISHHLPSYQSVSQMYDGSPLNAAYASHLDYLFEEYDGVVLAVHGHTHSSFDYIIDNTRVICNPFGYYPNDLNPNFNSELIIDI